MAGKKKGKASNLLRVPSPETDDWLVNLADWVEIRALLESDGKASQEDLARALQRAHSIDETAARTLAGDVFKELADRRRSCIQMTGKGGELNYPFGLNKPGNLLTFQIKPSSRSRAGILYVFLLVATRADMDSSRRKLAGLDPTQVFERLCADILLNFWGGRTEYSDSLIFGTARKKSAHADKFQANIENLCKMLRHGGGLKTGATPPGGGDGKLNVVAWRVFPDARSGALIGFAQCKTGIHWRDHLTKLNPAAFCGTYLERRVIIDPMRVYMVPHRIDGAEWDECTFNGGLLFDRCRLVQYGYEISADVFKDCRTWLNAAIDRQRKGGFAV